MIVVNDSFTAADGTLLQGHAGEEGASTWTKHSVSGAAHAKINSNRVYLDSAGGDFAFYYPNGSPISPEYDVEADFVCLVITGAAGRPRLLARIDVSAETWYEVVWDGANIFLNKDVATVVTNVGSSALTAVDGETHAIMAQIRDSAKKVFLDTIEIITSADNAITSNGPGGVGFVGAQTTTDGIHIDNFVVTDLAVEEVLIRNRKLSQQQRMTA